MTGHLFLKKRDCGCLISCVRYTSNDVVIVIRTIRISSKPKRLSRGKKLAHRLLLKIKQKRIRLGRVGIKQVDKPMLRGGGGVYDVWSLEYSHKKDEI